MGVIPNSINVPLLLANIIRSQYRGSDVSDETMPYNGIWLMIKKIRSVSFVITPKSARDFPWARDGVS